jgi:hypothetical protein
MSDMPTAEMMMSGLSSWRNGWRSAASISASVKPLALASMSARSRMVTISWSRSCGDSSRSQIKAITNTTSPAMPEMRYSWVQKCGSATIAGMVALPTTATMRLPSTRPLVQKPMAVARPTCGEKSRISAGVATRQTPSTKPTTKVSMVNGHLFVAAGRMNATNTPLNSSPNTTRLARPSRSVIPANKEPNAPIRFPNASAIT